MYNKYYLRIVLWLVAFGYVFSIRSAECQDSCKYESLALKTNLLYDAGGVPSLALEIPFSKDSKWRIDISGSYNPFRTSETKFWKNWMLQPEVRFYPRRHSGYKSNRVIFYLAANVVGGQYNLQDTPLIRNIWPSLKESRFEGYGIGAGAGIGIRWDLFNNFGIEFEATAGYIYSKYNRYLCGDCGERTGYGTKNLIAPTKLALNLVYSFNSSHKKVKPSFIVRTILRDTLIVERLHRDTLIIRDTVRYKPEIREDQLSLNLNFIQNGAAIDTAFQDNTTQLTLLSRFIDKYRLDPTLKVSDVIVEGYSSIEGSADYNLRLSEKRAHTVANYLSSVFPELSFIMKHKGCGEDWDSLDFPDKDKVLAIPDYDTRQKKLMEMDKGLVFKSLLKEQLPFTRKVLVRIIFTKLDNTL